MKYITENIRNNIRRFYFYRQMICSLIIIYITLIPVVMLMIMTPMLVIMSLMLMIVLKIMFAAVAVFELMILIMFVVMFVCGVVFMLILMIFFVFMVMIALFAMFVVMPIVRMLFLVIMIVVAYMLFIHLGRFQNTLSQLIVVARVIVILMIIVAEAKHSSWVVPLNLDGSVENLIFISKNICGFFNCDMWLRRPHVCANGQLARGERSQVEIMNLINLFNFQDVLEALDHIHTLRGGFHHHRDAVSEYRHCCEDACYSEDHSANRISYVRLRVEEDY